MAVPVPRRLFTVDEYYAMAKHGILKPDERVELLDGEIVPMNPIGSAHAWCVTDLLDIFAPLIGRIILRIQNPLRLDPRAEREPDIAILRPDAPRNRHPGPDETLHADRIEVYRDPTRSQYRSVTLLGRGASISPQFAPDVAIDVSMVLGKDRPETS